MKPNPNPLRCFLSSDLGEEGSSTASGTQEIQGESSAQEAQNSGSSGNGQAVPISQDNGSDDYPERTSSEEREMERRLVRLQRPIGHTDSEDNNGSSSSNGDSSNGNGGNGSGGNGNGGNGSDGNDNDGSDADDEGEEAEWQPIDADPVNFNEMLGLYNMHNVIVEEQFTLDQFDYLRRDKTFGIIAAHHNPALNPVEVQVQDVLAVDMFFRGNRPVNASATMSLVSILANAPLVLGNVLDAYITSNDNDAGDRVVKTIQNSRPALEEADLDPEEMNDEEDIANQTGDLYHYVGYLSFSGYIWEFDCRKRYPERLGAAPETGNWIGAVKNILAEKLGTSLYTTTFLAVKEHPREDLENTYTVVEQFDQRVVEQLNPGTRFPRDAGEVLSQIHQRRIRTRIIEFLRNLVNHGLPEAIYDFVQAYGLDAGEDIENPIHTATPPLIPAPRGRGTGSGGRQVTRARTGGRVRKQPTRASTGGRGSTQATRTRGIGRGQTITTTTRGAKTTTQAITRGKAKAGSGRGAGQRGAKTSAGQSRKRQRESATETEQQRQTRVKQRYNLRKRTTPP